jgi:RNA polymerase sigma-70 factor, ECF subfamily
VTRPAPLGGPRVDPHGLSTPPQLAPVVALRSPAPALEEVWEQEHLALFRFVKSVVHDQELAEDILQEAFLRLLGEISGGGGPDNAHAWLYRVATNLVISRGRRDRTAQLHLPELVLARQAASPERRALLAERDEAVRAALASLPIQMRAAVVLASSGFTAREIGSALAKSEGAVRMLVSRGRLRVRAIVDAADVDRSTEAS